MQQSVCCECSAGSYHHDQCNLSLQATFLVSNVFIFMISVRNISVKWWRPWWSCGRAGTCPKKRRWTPPSPPRPAPSLPCPRSGQILILCRASSEGSRRSREVLPLWSHKSCQFVTCYTLNDCCKESTSALLSWSESNLIRLEFLPVNYLCHTRIVIKF